MPAKGLARRRTAAEVLLDKGLVPAEKIREAEEAARKDKKPFIQAIVDAGAASKHDMLAALSEEWKVQAVDLTKVEMDFEAARIIPESAARRHGAVPFAKEENLLYVAMADPKDFFVCEDIELRTGLQVQGVLAVPQDISDALDNVYGRSGAATVSRLIEEVAKKDDLGQSTGVDVLSDQVKTDITEVDASAPEVEKLVNAIILTALSMKASDIHIEPLEDPTGRNSRVLVRYRVDGQLVPGPFNVPWGYRNAIAAKIKIMTNSMNITERRIPQSGRIQILAQGNPIEFRVEIVPAVYGESCVMRILDRKAAQVDIGKMGFLPDTQEKFLSLLKGIGGKKNFGLILLCGPTGSGKSTTLYAALNHINRPDIKILTAENPVEYNLDGIIQVPVNPDLKLGEDKFFDFATALRSFLRLDPDVIMVGEIRDRETAHISMEAAMTGHLVFSTIHTNDAPSAISRLVEMGIPAYMVATTLKAVMAQRLSRKLCEKCKVPHDPTPEEKQVFAENGVEIKSDAKIYGPSAEGCEACKKLAFRGRIGLHELLAMSDSLRALCLKEIAADPIRHQALKEGMRPIVQDGLHKVLMGLTTVREVLGGVE
ncbi:MAG TPA: ATPase, T2SS/T4P/T4SS family [Elusimicrobiota bacterium]|nr:ATPase, T2SS/T4P/T4SS family [Elusimicrobiota bacterium]